MTYRLLLGLLLSGVLLGGGPGYAQPEGTLKGVVWQAPEDLQEAEAELRAMQEAGVQAVRTGPIRHERLLALADTLGLAFYQDLPASHLSTEALHDTLNYLTQELERMLLVAEQHPSARHFGLFRTGDVTDPSACAAIEELAQRVERDGPSGSRSYYLSPFVEADACVGAVDEVLLDVLNRDDPVELVRRWRAVHGEAAVGIGALGTWVSPRVGKGLRVPHSPEAQARYLEEHLPPLVDEKALPGDTSAGSSTAVFVYRWRDRAPTAFGRRTPPGRRYGLHGEDGAPLPAFRVVKGTYTGEQITFAFPTGETPPSGPPWLILMGWGALAALGIFYANAPRFRRMAPRYFRAHGFYRDAIREGRDVLTGASMVLLAAISIGVGLLLTVFFLKVQETHSFDLLMQRFSEMTQGRVVALLKQPWLLASFIAAIYALGLLLWALLLALLSRWLAPLRPEQTFMLAVWPRWPMLVLMIGAMAASTYPADTAIPLLLGLLAAWGLITLSSSARTLHDYSVLTRSSFYALLTLVLTSPVFLLGIVGLFTALEHASEVRFIWHLLTRT